MATEIAILALIISIASIILNIHDRIIGVTVDTGVEYVMPEDPEEAQYGPLGKRIWITITNNSMRRVFITNIFAVWAWSTSPLNKKRHTKINLEDIQRYEEDKPVPVSRFWIEPLGNALVSSDIEEIENILWNKLVKKFGITKSSIGSSIYYRIVVTDAQQNEFPGKWAKIEIPPIAGEEDVFQ